MVPVPLLVRCIALSSHLQHAELYRYLGTAIYIYGVDAPNSASVQFTLDDDASTTQTHQYSGDSIVYDAALYTASGLTNGQHTLSFTVTGVPEGGSLGYVDYAVVTQFHDEPELIVN